MRAKGKACDSVMPFFCSDGLMSLILRYCSAMLLRSMFQHMAPSQLILLRQAQRDRSVLLPIVRGPSRWRTQIELSIEPWIARLGSAETDASERRDGAVVAEQARVRETIDERPNAPSRAQSKVRPNRQPKRWGGVSCPVSCWPATPARSDRGDAELCASEPSRCSRLLRGRYSARRAGCRRCGEGALLPSLISPSKDIRTALLDAIQLPAKGGEHSAKASEKKPLV